MTHQSLALDRPLTVAEQTLLDLLEKMKHALERLPTERADAEKDRNVVRKNYILGMCDGVEETCGALAVLIRDGVHGILATECKGCQGGYGLADNAHTRTEGCSFQTTA